MFSITTRPESDDGLPSARAIRAGFLVATFAVDLACLAALAGIAGIAAWIMG